MNDANGYFVFLHPQAIEALGAPIKPYLLGEGEGQHILCREIDTGGALIEMTLAGQTPDGKVVQIELMVPGSMVRMIVSAHGGDEQFGFQPRFGAAPAQALPPVGPTGAPAEAAPQSVPAAIDAPTQTPPKP
ncbi:hypothetical protein [Lysobacter solisilvae (ex Woo and Kim 2020)]|uniref:Uncharacterized protein n=1 Tax=Agrilutibacter terrestris TaxID=2865112 RepID=A0A7H0FVN4_9GAMM|nr:hypothetical protein [Lysobacter terrestris]QNP40100.1 hypothetical protein H8B22_11430 [Lysobacter terrestris]